MALFRKDKEEPVVVESSEATQAETSAAAQPPAVDYERIIAGVTDSLKGLFPQQQAQAAREDDDDTLTAEERTRYERIATAAAAKAVAPYADVFSSAMPTIARESAVNKLSKGDRMIYNEHKTEVDAAIANAIKMNPAAAANPELHERAIQFVLGQHTDKVAAYAIKYMEESELPPAFARPTTDNTKEAKVELSAFDQNALEYYQTRKNNQQKNWNEENFNYFKNLKPGYLKDMVAQHKANTKKD